MEALTDETRDILGLLLALMATLGIFMCIVEIREILRLKRILPFKFLGLSHAIIHMTAQLIVVILFVSSQMILVSWVNPPLVGYVALALQFASLYTTLAMSVNRLISVSFPKSCSMIFTPTGTKIMAISAWIIAFSTSSILLIDNCNLAFTRENGGFSFQDTKCGRILSNYVEVAYNITLVLIAVPLDITSLFLLRRITKERMVYTRILRKEKPWFIQTLMNSLLFAAMLACFQATPLFHNEVIQFFFTVVSWQIWLMSPQVVGIIVQKEYRHPYLKMMGMGKSNAVDVLPTTSPKNREAN